MRVIRDELWPTIEARLASLNSECLVPFIELYDQWLRVSKGGLGIRGKPVASQRRVAGSFAKVLLKALIAACDGKPGAQVRLRDVTSLLRIRAKQSIDPDFALLSVDTLRVHRHGRPGFVQARVDKQAARWAKMEPEALVSRLHWWSEEAAMAGRSLGQGLRLTLRSMVKHLAGVDHINELIERGLQAALTYELGELMVESIARSLGVPTWFDIAVATPARRTAIAAAVHQSANADAARAGMKVMDERDLWDAEQAVMQRREPDWVSRALLNHPNDAIRGTASLHFSFGEQDHAPGLPAEWVDEWSAAFEVAPVEGRSGGGNWRMGQHLRRLVDTDPELVERWLTNKLEANPHGVLWRLPDRLGSALERLPRDLRTRLMRRFAGDWIAAELLGQLLGSDAEWLGQLVDEGVVPLKEAVSALRSIESEGGELQIDKALAAAPALLRRGADPARIAAAAEPSSWTGPFSAHYESMRAAFQARLDSASSEVRPVIEAGMRMYGVMRDRELEAERRKRVEGVL